MQSATLSSCFKPNFSCIYKLDSLHNVKAALKDAELAQARKDELEASSASLGVSPPANDRAYHRRVAWQTTLFERPLQRVPFVWDDKRRMERLAAQMKASGLPDPADPARPLPPTLPPCATPSVMYKPAAERDALGGVKGDAWEGMAAGGYVLPPRKAAS